MNSLESVNAICALLEIDIDVSNCLTNCSSQGTCDVSSNNPKYYICNCDPNYGGPTCEQDLRPCSKLQCVNDGICINKINGSTYDFECNCTFPYSGQRCELKQNLCLNKTCSKQGICVMNKTAANCFCFKGYSGLNCEIVSQLMKTHKSNVQVIAILAILALVGFVLFILALDALGIHINKQKAKKLLQKQNKIVIKKQIEKLQKYNNF